MRTTKTGEIAAAFIVDADALNNLMRIFYDRSTEIKLSAKLSDGSTVYPEKLDEILAIPNTKKRSIIEIKLENHYKDPTHIDVTLAANQPFWTMSFTFKGDDERILVVDRDFQDWVMTVKQPYTSICFVTFTSVLLVAAIFLAGVTLISIQFPASQHPWYDKTHSFFGLMLLAFGFSTFYWVGRVFPRGVFAIGDGSRRHISLRARRKQLGFLTLLVAVITGLVSALIGKLLGL